MPVKRVDKTPMPERDAVLRSHDFVEVNEGYNIARARFEAERCLRCQDPICIEGCPVKIPIPDFIHSIAAGDMAGAAKILRSEDLSSRRPRSPLGQVLFLAGGGEYTPGSRELQERDVARETTRAVGGPVLHVKHFLGDHDSSGPVRWRWDRPAQGSLPPDECFRTSTRRFCRSEGDTPGMRPACPIVLGLTDSSFWRASYDRLWNSR